MGKLLQGYSVLVTRPHDQAVGLCAAIEAEGGKAILAPMIVIRPISDRNRCGALIDRIDDYDSVIFISRSAVEFGIKKMKQGKHDLTGQTIYAVGVGTATGLRERGYPDIATPRGEFTSEGLLKLEGLQAHKIARAKILIFRGAGGREHLAKTLARRGAKVDYCEVYERIVPDICVADTLSEADVSVPDIGVITSLESLTTFADKIEEEGLDLLFDMPLLVVGSRIAREVGKLGFTNPPVIVDNPSNGNVIDTLTQWVLDEI
jgi:uroporphyrinogen-III synthase